MKITLFNLLLLGIIFNAHISETHASFWDSLPIISQGKSFVQYLKGDSAGARKTQDNFLRTSLLPIIPIIRSSVEAIKGDHTAARDTWRQYGNLWGQTVDSIPVVGHVKGGIHYAVGDTERGHQVMKASTRPVGVILGGIAGAVTGPAGAVAGGIIGGAAMDGIITGVESAIRKEYTPHGHIHSVTKIAQGKATAVDYASTALTLVGDGVGGYFAGKPFMKKPGGSVAAKSAPCTGKRRKRSGDLCLLNIGKVKIPDKITDPYAMHFQHLQKPNVFKQWISKFKPKSPAASPSASVHLSGGKTLLPKVALPAFGGVVASSIGARPDLNPKKLGEVGKPGQDVNQEYEKNKKEKDEKIKKEKEEKKKKDDEEETNECENQPEIQNRDTEEMIACEGTEAGQFCTVKCLEGLHQTENRVQCVWVGIFTVWSSKNILCLPDPV